MAYAFGPDPYALGTPFGTDPDAFGTDESKETPLSPPGLPVSTTGLRYRYVTILEFKELYRLLMLTLALYPTTCSGQTTCSQKECSQKECSVHGWTWICRVPIHGAFDAEAKFVDIAVHVYCDVAKQYVFEFVRPGDGDGTTVDNDTAINIGITVLLSALDKSSGLTPLRHA